MQIIEFGPDTFSDIEGSLQREWLETNGLGGFASSTILGLNTRRYHGLLTAATRPPGGRMVLLSKLEDAVIVEDKRYDLSANQYPGVLYPRGFEFLASFRLHPFPVFTYRIGETEIEKRVFLVHGENTVIVEYALHGGPDCTLELRPLIAYRDFHNLTHRNESLNPNFVFEANWIRLTPYAELPPLHIAHNGAVIEQSGNWYYNFEYERERERGLDFQEDLFNPFVARYTLSAGETATFIASTQPVCASDAPELRRRETTRRSNVIAASPSTDPLIQSLAAAADQFLVKRGEWKTIIAGYHWFGDWGRDTMIALPGITLVTSRFEVARRILLAFAASLDQGMLPNRFTDAGESAEYNTADATLWLFEAIRSYIAWTGDTEFIVREMYPRLNEVIEWHLRGARYGIKVDSDGLLRCGEPGSQLTWMDAKIGDWVVTPRCGKPVEIQALWYNALRVQEHLASVANDPDRELFFGQMADLARASFNRLFWNADKECLYDVVDGENRDSSIRPNQVFAISLHHAVLDEARWFHVMQVVRKELWTPSGLRTLSPKDAAYRPAYEGDVPSRDSAYHQGTVWAWLMGPFITAYVKLHGRSQTAREEAGEWLRGFGPQMMTAGLGQIAEIADAEAPHKPKGCIAQAWSVAELLRAAVEDVFQLSPAPLAANDAGTAMAKSSAKNPTPKRAHNPVWGSRKM
jgi:predicted glycogen debranching enzyme